MTKFQALFVLYLRHEQFCGCSWKALSAHYYNRYNFDNSLKEYKSRIKFRGITTGGNQIDGMMLEKEAHNILFKEEDIDAIGMTTDLYECDLTYVNANLKNNIII